MMLNLVLLVFVAGYLLIAFEHKIKIDKAAIAILTGALCWAIIISFVPFEKVVGESLEKNIGEISGILFFLIGAMTIVELIDLHNGFDIVVQLITAKNKIGLLWIITFITFFLSPLLDNLTTTIVMISILQKLMKDDKDKLWFAGMIVISANSGGVWSPIGDVTTTMLWIGGQLSVMNIITKLFIPSLISVLIPLFIVSYQIHKANVVSEDTDERRLVISLHKKVVLFAGIILLLMVPVIKYLTDLPPYICMLFSLGVLWVLSELLHRNKEKEVKKRLSVSKALEGIDMPSILFFLGILLSVGALQETGFLHKFASSLTGLQLGDKAIAISLGVLSALIDNVPLVAASMKMFPLDFFHSDHNFWSMLAFTSGTGGSMLIIGSAAGIVAMGMTKIGFFWYLKNFTWIAMLGFLAGCLYLILV